MQRYALFAVVGSSILSAAIVLSAGWFWQDELLARLLASQPVSTSQATTTVSTSSPPQDSSTPGEPVADMVTAVNPAVVSVMATKDVPVYERVYEEYSPFGGMFGGRIAVPRLRESGTEEREVGGGSGFLVSADGMIVTNRHVVSDQAASYAVMFSNGETQPVTVLARDDVLDIAILEMATTSATEWPFLPLGDSDSLRLGQQVVAIGNALAEFDNTVSTGVVSGLSRSITARDQMGSAEQLDRVIQTDAAINPGNSGGPLLNLRGEVVGVNVAASLQAQNIGFALPINAISHVIESVQSTGEIARPFLGVRYRPVTERFATESNLPVSYGVMVLRGQNANQVAVVPKSPAAEAGIQEGDIIFAIDDMSLEAQSLSRVLQTYDVGDTVTLRVWRNGEELTLPATLTAA